jgi:hypothetical protein
LRSSVPVACSSPSAKPMPVNEMTGLATPNAAKAA